KRCRCPRGYPKETNHNRTRCASNYDFTENYYFPLVFLFIPLLLHVIIRVWVIIVCNNHDNYDQMQAIQIQVTQQRQRSPSPHRTVVYPSAPPMEMMVI